MIYTNNVNDDSTTKCYFKLAFERNHFSKLSINERKDLIEYTIKQFDNQNLLHVTLSYQSIMTFMIGKRLSSKGINEIIIFENNLINYTSNTYSYELYMFLFMTIYSLRKARRILEESIILKIKKKVVYKKKPKALNRIYLEEIQKYNDFLLSRNIEDVFFIDFITRMEIEKRLILENNEVKTISINTIKSHK